MDPVPLTFVVSVNVVVAPPDGASDASECASRLAPLCVQPSVVAPAAVRALVLMAPVMPLAATSTRSVWPLAAVKEPELPLPTTSTIQELVAALVMLVEIESAPLVSTLVAAFCGAD